jgi:DNA-binding transcriptional regulator GbsR (MarR family)
MQPPPTNPTPTESAPENVLTPSNSRTPGALDPVEQEFVDLWRGMGSLWGISPTMAEIHGLLFITGDVLSMDDIMARLSISRGNVSMNLTKLLEWGLIRRVHRREPAGARRRDYYESIGDVWEMFTLIAAQRKRRELDPMLNTLRQCRDRLAAESQNTSKTSERRRRVGDLVDFLSLMDALAQKFFESHKSLRTALDLLSRKEK